jgi:hypothetical protein
MRWLILKRLRLFDSNKPLQVRWLLSSKELGEEGVM